MGDAQLDPASPWWVFERLQRLVARAPESAPWVREAFATLQNEFVAEAAAAELRASDYLAAGNETEAIATLRLLVDSTTERAIALAAELTVVLPNQSVYRPIPEMAAFWDERDAAVLASSIAS